MCLVICSIHRRSLHLLSVLTPFGRKQLCKTYYGLLMGRPLLTAFHSRSRCFNATEIWVPFKGKQDSNSYYLRKPYFNRRTLPNLILSRSSEQSHSVSPLFPRRKLLFRRHRSQGPYACICHEFCHRLLWLSL